MSQEQQPLGLADYGLTDSAVLEAATRMAPELFTALRIAQALDVSHFPIISDVAVERALEAVANNGKQFTFAGIRITGKGAKDRFPKDLLPIEDKNDLLRKVYLALIISHRESARQDWTKAQTGSLTLTASHPLPTEVF